MIDPVTNFAKDNLSAGYSAVATSIIITNPSKFPPISEGAFNLVWWNSTDYADPSDDPNREIVRVTNIASNVFTITRAQEGTSASSKNTAGKTYTVALTPTKKTIDDIRTELNEKVSDSELADIAFSGDHSDLNLDDGTNPHGTTKSDVGLGNVDNTSDVNKPVSTAQQTALDLKINVTEKGANNGVAELDAGGKVPATQLPSYVDDVLEFANFASLPVTGTTGIIYITLDDNQTYRWSGSAYVVISPSLALGETSSTAYRGDRGKIAYDHSQITSGNPHGTTKSDIGLGNVDDTSDVNKPVSTAQQTALDTKQDKVVVVSSSITAVLDRNYANVATATYTDPSPVEGKGFTVFVRNGTATVGGTAYATAGTLIIRTFHSGSWSNTVFVPQGNMSGDVIQSTTGTITAQPAIITGKSSATVASGDLVLIADINDSNNLKQVTAQSIADLGSGGIQQMFVLYGATTLVVPASSTRFMGLEGRETIAASEVGAEIVMQKAGTVKGFYLTTFSSQPVSGSLVITVRKNGADTSLTFTIAAGSAAGTYGTDVDVSYVAGDKFSVSSVNNASASSAQLLTTTAKII